MKELWVPTMEWLQHADWYLEEQAEKKAARKDRVINVTLGIAVVAAYVAIALTLGVS